MKRPDLKKHHYPYRHKIFLTVLLTAVLPLLILGLYSYHTYVKALYERRDLMAQVTANQVRSRVENLLDNVKKYYSDVENREELQSFIFAEELTYNQYSKLKQGMDVLSGPIYLRDYIQSYTFINILQDWVVSTYGMYHYSDMTNAGQIMEALREQRESRVQCYWLDYMGQPRPAEYTVLPARTGILSGYVMAVRMPMLALEDRCLLLVNLDERRLLELITENLGDMDITVINTRGELLYASNPLMGEYCAGHMEEWDDGRGMRTIRLSDRSRHRITAAQATTNGVLYIASYNTATVTKGARQILSISIVLLLVSAIVVVISHFGTRLLYTPVSELAAQIDRIFSDTETEEERGGSEKDDLVRLQSGFTKLVRNKEALEQMVGAQREVLEELFLTRLIRGELTQERIDEDIRRFHLQKRQCYIVMDMRGGVETIERDALSITIREQLPESVRDKLFATPINRNGVLLFLLGAETEEKAEKAAEEIFTVMSEHVNTRYGVFLYCGVSRAFERLKHLRNAHNEALEALKNIEGIEREEKNEGNEISFFSDLNRNVWPTYQYDLFAEQDIRRAVDACDRKAAFEIVDRFLGKMAERGVTRQDQYFYLNRFQLAILQVASEAGLSMTQIFGEEELSMLLDSDTAIDGEELRSFYKNRLINPVIDNLEQYRRSHSTDILKQVLALVKEKNGDITLTECAGQLGCHPSYIWRVLKTEKNMTFTDFVAEEKLEMAKELLLTTDCPVADIAKKLNYTNTQNFIRFFSKHEGTTPGKYRQEKRKKTE